MPKGLSILIFARRCYVYVIVGPSFKSYITCVGEKPLPVQTTYSFRGLEADGHDLHPETFPCPYLSVCELHLSDRHHAHRHTNLWESALVVFLNQGSAELIKASSGKAGGCRVNSLT